MPIGIGLAPAGTSLAGYGVVDPSTVPATKILVNPYSGFVEGARRIDPSSRQYQFDSSGRVVGMNPIQQQVYLAMATVRGSSAIANFGNGASGIQKIGTSTTKQLQDAYRLALKDLTDRKVIAILSIDVVYPKTGTALGTVRWSDLTTGLEQATTV